MKRPVGMPRPSASLVISLLALLISLSSAASALPGKNRVDSGDIVDETIRGIDIRNGAVRGGDVAEWSLDRGVLQRRLTSDCAVGEAIRAVATDGSVACETSFGPGGPAGGDLMGEYPAPAIATDAVGFDELAAATFNADIAEQGSAFGIPNDAIQGFEVQNDTLTGADINESTLGGIVRGRGDAACCAIRAGVLNTQDPYSATDPGTSIDLGAFDLRSTATGEPDKMDLCNPPGGVNFGASAVLYTGGPHSSTTDTRARWPLPFEDTCRTIDVNGTDTTGSGDFRMLIPERAWEATLVQGASFGTNTGFTIFAVCLCE